MLHYLIALRLPNEVCRRLAMLCFGLPDAIWETEENFVVSLHPLGKLGDALLDDVKEVLQGISAPPVSVTLSGIQVTGVGRSKARLWVAIEPTPPLATLQKKLHTSLMSLGIQPSKEKLIAHVYLGHVASRSSSRLADYLSNASYFTHPPFECSTLSLLSANPSGYRVVAEYQLKMEKD